VAANLVSGQHGDHLGQDAQDVSGQLLWVFEGLLGGLALGVVVLV
jgi:hypothetical protein